LILISSQIPAGTCRAFEARFPGHRFAYSPENPASGQALSIFTKADRIILGVRTEGGRQRARTASYQFTQNLIIVRTESCGNDQACDQLVLASSIALMNEISRICEQVGADAKEVERGLKSEPRIGPGAYLSPGGPFAGGTLARDIVALTKLAKSKVRLVLVRPLTKQ